MTSFQYFIESEGQTIENLLRNVWQTGKKVTHELRMKKGVTTMMGEPVPWHVPLPLQTALLFSFPQAVSSYQDGINRDVNVLYEDAHILAVYKRAGVPTHPNHPQDQHTLMNDVIRYVRKNGGTYAEHVHRLDEGTDGVVVIAKNPISKGLLDRAFEQHQVKRVYTAEVEGLVRKKVQTIRQPIGRNRHIQAKRIVSPNGQLAVTHLQTLTTANDRSRVQVELETGRTHQIRVHLSYIGHPIIGDTLYGAHPTTDGYYRLTASTVAFSHPITREQIEIHCPVLF